MPYPLKPTGGEKIGYIHTIARLLLFGSTHPFIARHFLMTCFCSIVETPIRSVVAGNPVDFFWCFLFRDRARPSPFRFFFFQCYAESVNYHAFVSYHSQKAIFPFRVQGVNRTAENAKVDDEYRPTSVALELLASNLNPMRTGNKTIEVVRHQDQCSS